LGGEKKKIPRLYFGVYFSFLLLLLLGRKKEIKGEKKI
jgi:hypothetical protein